MKKSYFYMLSAMVAFSSAMTAATAQNVATEIVAHRSIDPTTLGPLKTWEEVSKNFRTDETKAAPAAAFQMTTPAAKAPAAKVAAPMTSIDDLVNTLWDASYIKWLDDSPVNGVGSFEYLEDYEELDLNLPDSPFGLYVGYADGELTIYGSVNYGSNSNGNIVLCPIDFNTGSPLTSSNITVYYNEETGEFEFDEDFAWGLCAIKQGQLLGFYWSGYGITLKVSEGDFRINAALEDECTPTNKFKFSVNPGPDAAQVKALILGIDADPELYADYIGSLGSVIEAGQTYIIDPVASTAIGPMTESGHASILFASYDAEGNRKSTESLSMIVVLEEEDGWRNVGNMTYTDQLFAYYYNGFSHSQEAMLQEKEDAPGFYRIVNPYSERNIHNEDCPHYFLIDTRDQEWVTIPFSVSGLDVGGDGILTFGTAIVLDYDKESAQAKNLLSGTMDGQTITFPAKSIFCHEQFYNKPGSWSYFNAGAATTITLPDITVEVTVLDVENNPIEGAIVRLAENTNDDIETLADEEEQEDILTDADGKATITVPFETGYFGTATLNISKTLADDKSFNDTKEVDLNGTYTAISHVANMKSGISNVSLDNNANAPAEYFNLQGIRVDNPENGLFIRRQGNTTTKVVVK